MDDIQFFSLLATILIAAAALGGLIIAQFRWIVRRVDQRFSELNERFYNLEQRVSKLE